MKLFIALLLWALLLAFCWPLALLVLVVWPVLWLLSIPFRLVAAVVHAAVALVTAVLLLPSRVLRGRA